MADLLGPHIQTSTRWDCNQRTGGYIPHLDALVQVGECLLVKDAVNVIDTLTSRLCRIETAPRLLTPEPDEQPNLTGYYAKVVWYFTAADVCRSEHLRVPLLNSPDDRTYIEYPTPVVESQYVQWVRVEKFSSEAIVLTKKDMDNGDFAVTIGMENAATLVGRWDINRNRILSLLPGPSPFMMCHPDSYTHRKFLFVKKIAACINLELSKPSFQQRVTSTQRLDCTEGEWCSLKARFQDRVDVVLRPKSICTRIVPRKFGSREAVKERVTVEAIRADTRTKIAVMGSIFGKTVLAGVRILPRVQGNLRQADGIRKYAVMFPVKTDAVFGYFKMPRECHEPFKMRSALPRIDLIYNPLLTKLFVKLRYFSGMMSERAVKNTLNRNDAYANINGTGAGEAAAAVVTLNFSEDSDDESNAESSSDSDDDDAPDHHSASSHESSLKASTLLIPEETEFEVNGIMFLCMIVLRQRLTDKKYLETIVVDQDGALRHVRHARRHWLGAIELSGDVRFTRIEKPQRVCEFEPKTEGVEDGDQPVLDDCVYWDVHHAITLVEAYNS